MKAAVTVKENYEFRRIYRKGKSLVSPQMVLYWQKNRQGQSRLGVTVSTKLGHAVVRNRVRRRFRALGKDIDSRLALDMIFLCGDLMTNLIGEIEKVGAYARQKHITMGDIQAVATPQLDAVVFRMTDAIGEGKFDQAMSVLGELYQMQEPPIKIMWSVGRQMRQLYSARLALEQGRGPTYVAQLWGIKPYPSEKLMRSAKRFSLKWCRRAVVRCGQIDLAMKSSGQDGKELLTGLMLELANPV